MDRDKLLKLLKQREGPKLDYKLTMALASETHKKELSKDVIALANTSGGRGHIVVGVRDKTKELVGVNPEDYPEEKIQQIIQNRCDPPIAVEVTPVEVEGKWLIVLTVFKSMSRPHQMRQTGAFYIRRGSTTDFAHREEVAAMLQASGLVVPEAMPVRNAKLSDLDPDLLRRYSHQQLGEGVEIDPRDYHTLMQLGLVFHDSEDNRHYPTVGALMLFGAVPQRFLPHTGVKCIVLDGQGQRSTRFFEGGILSLLDQTLAFVETLCEGYHYPIALLEEAICNALVHRDYYEHTREITLFISDKRIEVTNPGAIEDAENLQHVVRTATPRRRNPWLYGQAMRLDDKNRFTKYGLGLTKIQKITAEVGGVRFVNLKRKNVFKVLLPGLKAFYKPKSLPPQ